MRTKVKLANESDIILTDYKSDPVCLRGFVEIDGEKGEYLIVPWHNVLTVQHLKETV